MNKLKYLSSLCFFGVLLLSSCTKEELKPSNEKEFIFLDAENSDLFFERGNGSDYPSAGIRVVLHSENRASTTNYSFEILDSSTAVEDQHYRMSSTGGTIPANTVIDTLPIEILTDNLIPCESMSLHVRLVSSDLERTDQTVLEINLNLESSSELAGTVNYVHSDNFAGEELNGKIEIMALEDAGQYMLSDFSFGAWSAAYGIDPPTGTLRWSNNCSSIALSGTDNYGDVWQMDEVLSSGGPEFVFTWSNTYGEFGVVSLTRQDGKDWPNLEL